jgi:hypothetical protein
MENPDKSGIVKGFDLLCEMIMRLEADDIDGYRELNKEAIELQKELFGKDYSNNPRNPLFRIHDKVAAYMPGISDGDYLDSLRKLINDRKTELGLTKT